MVALTKHAPGSICWIDLRSADLEQTKGFYGTLFGWTFTELPDTGGALRIQQQGRDVGGLSGPMPGEAHGGPSLWTGYFSVEDLEATAQRITRLGGKVLVPATQVQTLGERMVARDPTGAIFGMWKKGTFGGMSVMAEPGTLLWSQCESSEPKQAVPFYEQVFGLETRLLEPPPYWTLRLPPGRDEDAFGGILKRSPATSLPGTGSHWIFYFTAEDVPGSVQQVKALGGSVLQPVADTPFGVMARVVDPLGTPFMLMTPNPGSG